MPQQLQAVNSHVSYFASTFPDETGCAAVTRQIQVRGTCARQPKESARFGEGGYVKRLEFMAGCFDSLSFLGPPAEE
jgi:hypothetical protein